MRQLITDKTILKLEEMKEKARTVDIESKEANNMRNFCNILLKQIRTRMEKVSEGCLGEGELITKEILAILS